jgi:hypothetical protein
MTRRSQEPPGSAARPSPDGVETDRRGDEKLLHDRRAPDATDADWMTVAYAFLLGMYLGDGSIARHPRAYKLRVVQDARYPNSIEEIRRAMATVRHCELDRIRTLQHVGCVEVYTYWRHWPCVFPQHGPGTKHLRRIELAAWQASILAEQSASLLRGLIHSDGCRVINRVGKGSTPTRGSSSRTGRRTSVGSSGRHAIQSAFVLRIPNLTRSRSLDGWTSSRSIPLSARRPERLDLGARRDGEIW